MICCGLDLKYWDSIKDGLQESLDVDNNKYTLDDIKKALDEQVMQLWCLHEDNKLHVVFLTQIIIYPNAKVLECTGLKGENPHLWIDRLLTEMYQYAKQNHCDYMETGGRKGWEKMFIQSGWGNPRIKLSRRIDYV